MRLVPILLAFLASPVSADRLCDELWFTRNLVFDRAGYCFGSPLGRAVFGNAGCIGTEVSLSDADTSLVADIRSVEAEYNCAVDTSRRRLDFAEMNWRLRLEHLPVISGFESACIGWQVPPLPIRAGHHPDGTIIGEVQRGDQLNFGHYAQGDWEFVQVYRAGVFVNEGWVYWGFHDAGRCANWAG